MGKDEIDALLDSVADGVVVTDEHGAFLSFNRAAARIIGRGPTDAPIEHRGAHFGIFRPDRTTPFPKEEFTLARALAGEETNAVVQFIRNSGVPEGVLISVSGRPRRDPTGKIIGAVCVFHDITEVDRQRRELESQATEVSRLNEQLMRERARRRELALLLVHDLKSPISAILANGEYLREEAGMAGEKRSAVDDIMLAARSLHRMVMDLLDVELASDGKFEVERVPIDLASLLAEARAAIAVRAAQRHMRIVLAIQLTNAVIHADPDLVRRLVQNLLDNCVKYGAAGKDIGLEARDDDEDSVEIRVTDQGPGVPLHLRDAIFDLYARVERDERSRSRDSRGLGLHFCRLAAEAHGGRVWVEDNEPHGARFRLLLPRSAPPTG